MHFITDLRASGATPAQIAAVRRDSERLRRGAYVERGLGEWEKFRLRCQAVLNGLQPSAYLTGPAAAVAWDLPIVGDPPQRVTVGGVPRGTYCEHVRVTGGRHDVVEHNGQRVSSVAWTVLDCARMLPRRDGLIIADAALHERMTDREELRDLLQTLKRSRGIATARWVIGHADAGSESPGETWTRLCLGDAGLGVTSQFEVRDGDFLAHIDLVIRGWMVGIEFDGEVKYREPKGRTPSRTVMDEKRRQAILEGLGWRLVRVVWEQLDDPARLKRRVDYALKGASPLL